MDFDEFIRWEQSSRDTIDFKRIYVDVTGDLIAGLLLSQIIFWHLPDKNGHSKLRVKKGNKSYLVKKTADWWDECRITERRYRRAIKILIELNIVETEVHLFNNFPTVHIWLNRERFIEIFNKTISVSYKTSETESTETSEIESYERAET